jgi:cold shock CspA family protein/ribosome-associated translation inhibitor RaiA
MELPLQITFHNLPHSGAVEARIRSRAAKLEKYCDSIIGCRVAVEARHHHHRAGNHFLVRVEVAVPGEKLIANREPDAHHAYTDVYLAIRDAFDSARRQLEDYVRRRRGDVKAHATPPHGHIVELDADEGYGRIETPDGRLVYFHRNSVLGAEFASLELGTEVRFEEEMGERGPQASTLHVIGKHHIVG